ncbi:SDR family NAD(P)-dependent oxidoreductase [Streptomyces sp. NPDC058257]|uniref:SDR family NAD(P)-dependent oxidoreductase n=1 Tax=Streptomyces sp. NPDC058257 TaxID=3346409 RepID=UPI0036F0A056
MRGGLTTAGTLRGRVCLVTGGASGIGLQLVRGLAESGARVHVCDLSPVRDHDISTQLAACSVRFSLLDVTDRLGLEKWVRDVHESEGQIDVLVHNAAFVRWTDVERMPVQEAELHMRTGYDALVHLVSTALPLMRAQGHGHVVAVGSSVGRLFVAGPSAAYAATKAAIEAYTEILRMELADSGVAVTLVRPGVVRGTDFFRRHVPSTRMPRIADLLPATTPKAVADATVRAITDRRARVDVPRYLPLMYRLYALAPGSVRKLTALGGRAQGDYTHGTELT